MKKRLLAALCLSLSQGTYAAVQNLSEVAFTIKSDWRGSDKVTALGLEAFGNFPMSKFGYSFNSSLGYADVTTKTADKENYLTWDTGIKVGYFQNFFVYGEVGLDLFELLLHDLRNDDNRRNDDRYNDEPRNDLDAYVGVGAGMQFERIRVELYSRVRQIDGEHWESKERVFSGMQVSFMF
ncbi:hypothetical protein ACFOEE_12185 [Pseudoalteromonas fenneropenaei]|uniref:Outer membrane protein beta-barrel domain-containing protein n=1 Tax=Pseudoalteromonas fenneropenaei TaxID=1737459 RepID=A0ABV7CKW1_9GAMM